MHDPNNPIDTLVWNACIVGDVVSVPDLSRNCAVGDMLHVAAYHELRALHMSCQQCDIDCVIHMSNIHCNITSDCRPALARGDRVLAVTLDTELVLGNAGNLKLFNSSGSSI